MGIAFQNLDLLSVGIAVAGMLILGFITFFNNSKSLTSRLFLCLAVSASAWGIVNYVFYQVYSPDASFWLLRLVMFFAVWAAFFNFTLSYVFPADTAQFPKYYSRFLVPATVIISCLTLTPFVFSGIVWLTNQHVSQLATGPGIFLFGALVIFLNGGGIFFLIKKARSADDNHRRPTRIFLLGVIVMLSLIMIFNFILPAFFNNPRFVPLGALFLFPFIALTAYAILRHHLLDVKIIATEILAFLLAIISLAEVVLSTNIFLTLFRSSVFILILAFSILLIRSVRREVEQREELQKLNKQIAEQNDKLQDLSRFKSQLLSLASHQIKSPLASIKGFASLIVEGSYGVIPDTAKVAIAKIQHSADDLIGLINTLLDLRKVDEGKMEYKFGRTDLNKMVGDMVEMLKPLAGAKQLEFTFTSPGREVWVSADAEKLKQVIQNLTDNSIKYTPAGFVHVELKSERAPGSMGVGPGALAGMAVVSVSDSGVGIPADLIPHLFEEFVRDERVKKEILGTGLGLYIAQKIAEVHGGKITAESPGEGKGSTFRVTLPEIT